MSANQKGTHWIALLVNGVDGSISYDATYLTVLELNVVQKKSKNL